MWERLGISRSSLAKITEGDSAEKNFWRVPRRFWLLYQLSLLEDRPSINIATNRLQLEHDVPPLFASQ